MIRDTLRFGVAGVLAATLVYLFLSLSPAARAQQDAIDACASATTSACLTDLGVARAAHSSSRAALSNASNWLAQMERFDEAFALGLRAELARDRPSEAPEAAVDRRLASSRIAFAIRNGATLQDAIAQTPGVDAGALWIAALDLLGRRPHGSEIGPRDRPDARINATVAEMAERIAEMANTESEAMRRTRLVHAAELFATQGDREAALGVLEDVEPMERGSFHFRPDLINLIGIETALDIYRRVENDGPRAITNLLRADADDAVARELLDEAFDAFASDTPWPDFDWMERVVHRAAALELTDLALRRAHDIAVLAETDPDIFPVFAHIGAARALLAAGAEEQEVRAALARAQGDVPEDVNEVVGVGFHAGPMRWGAFGLDAQARREMAILYAALGEVETSVALMEGISDPVFAWNDMLRVDVPLAAMDRLIGAAAAALSEGEHAFVRVKTAYDLLLFGGGGDADRDWAHAMAWDMLSEARWGGDRAGQTLALLVRVADLLGDDALEGEALERLAEHALASRDLVALMRAGLLWHQSELVP